jgi:hypothetical protein
VAIRALARHGAAEDARLIAPQLEHANVQVRWEAAKGLQRLHDPTVVGKLLDVLRNPEEQPDVLIAAATALGQYPEDRVFQALVALLDHRELAANLAAEQSLHTLVGRSFGLDARAWLTWYNAQAGDRFAGRLEYLYPTYERDESWFERLAFWSNRVREYPAPPAGLKAQSGRETYQNDAPTPQDG